MARRIAGTPVVALLTLGGIGPVALSGAAGAPEPGRAPASVVRVGANMHAILHWGTEMYSRPTAADVDANLAEARRMGASVIRIFAANSLVGDETSARRLDAFLDKAATYRLSVIVSLLNHGCRAVSGGQCDYGYFPQGLNGYYTPKAGSTPTALFLDDTFFTDGAGVARFEEFVTTVVAWNRSHANIYAWEIGNEIDNAAIDPSHYAFTLAAFANDVHDCIRAADRSHPVSTGFSHEAALASAPAVYTGLGRFELISIHPYDGNRTQTPVADWAVARGKPVLVGEIGFSGSDRAARALAELSYWRHHGGVVALQWGFMAPGLSGAGSDGVYGMDTVSHGADYSTLFDLYRDLNRYWFRKPPLRRFLSPAPGVE